jgi:hypothetical protein
MQNSVILVRGSAGLKFSSELRVKGSARIDTDSSATARVEVDETVNNDGATAGAPKAVAAQRSDKTAQQIDTKHLRASKARVFIGSFLVNGRVNRQVRLQIQRKSLVGGHRAMHPGSADYSTLNWRRVNNF